MRLTLPTTLTSLAALSLAACGEPTRPTGDAPETAPSLNHAHASGSERLVTIMDACDPTTFNAVIGPGTCVREGGVTFGQFIAQLTRTQKAGGWMNAPSRMSAGAQQTLIAVNRGGETHTFTSVADFGGGIVPDLNQLSGLTDVAPECETLVPGDFVPAGATFQVQLNGPGTYRFECCIHPWMQTTVQVR